MSGRVCVPPFGEVCEADLAFDALFVTADAATRCTRLTGAAGVAEHLRSLSPVALYGWVLARRVYAAGQRMPAQTMLLFDREDRNTLVAIHARDRDKYDAERFVRIDSATSRYDQIGRQYLLPGPLFDVTEQIRNDY